MTIIFINLISSLLLFFLSIPGIALGDDSVVPEARLLTACMNNKADAQALLDVTRALKDGADIDVVDKRSKQTPLMAAVLRGKEQVVQYLLDQGANVHLAEQQGYTPAHGAAFGGHVGILKILKQHGIDVVADEHGDGYLPFHRACWGKSPGHAKVVEYLITLGVDPDLEAKNGKRCIEMTDNAMTIEVLTESGAEPARDDEEEDEL